MRDDLTSSADWARPLYEQQIAVLGELAELGMRLARGVVADAADEGADQPAAAVAFGRLSRAVRMTLMLQARFIKELQAWDRNADYRATVAGMERKAQVQRIVERVVYSEAADPDEAERLVGEAGERLDHDDIYGHVLSRPTSELVAMICKDFGLEPDWPKLAEEAWALEEMTNGSVGLPLAGLRPRPEEKSPPPSKPAGLPIGGRGGGKRTCPTQLPDVALHPAPPDPPPPMGAELEPATVFNISAPLPN